MKKGQVVKIGKNSKIEENILTELDSPICEPLEIAILIKDHLWESQETNDEAEHSDKNDHLEFNEEDEMRIRVPLSALKAANKPRMIAARLGINVENIYSFRRELRRQVKKMNHGIFQLLNKQVTRKTKAIRLLTTRQIKEKFEAITREQMIAINAMSKRNMITFLDEVINKNSTLF